MEFSQISLMEVSEPKLEAVSLIVELSLLFLHVSACCGSDPLFRIQINMDIISPLLGLLGIFEHLDLVAQKEVSFLVLGKLLFDPIDLFSQLFSELLVLKANHAILAFPAQIVFLT